jgi:endo-1,4-beta-xylanase
VLHILIGLSTVEMMRCTNNNFYNIKLTREDIMDKVKINSRVLYFEFIYKAIFICLFVSTIQLEAQPLAQGKDKFLGCSAVNLNQYNFLNYWNQLTPENAGKWGSVEGSQGSYIWTTLDSFYHYAINNNLLYKHHNLVWGSQQPSWITSLDSASQREEVRKWIDSVCTRYPNLSFIDVVNEPFNTPPPYLKALGGTGKTGWDWVITAFQWARQYSSPGVKLLVNEYNILQDNSITAKYIRLIDTLKVRNLIDGVGIQGHYFEFKGSGYSYPVSTLKSNLDKIGALGLPIYITEFDINEPVDSIQLANYKTYFPLFWGDQYVKGITLWGSMEGYTWKVNAYLINSDRSERPALTWLRSYVLTTQVTESKGTIPTNFSLEQNYPNPFNPTTTIHFSIPKNSNVKIIVTDLIGREVATLVNEWKNAGSYSVQWNGAQYSSGLYFYRLIAGNFVQVRKMLLIK